MTQRCLRVLARVLLVFAAVATTAGVSALSAQSTGKIQGYVRDAATQAPIVNATVLIPGFSYSALTDSKGYYFIENVPAGTYQLRAAFINYKAHELTGLRVSAGQTQIEDFLLESSPITLNAITVTAAANPLVPHDIVTTKQGVTGEMVTKLPVDRILQALALQPGIEQIGQCGTNLPCNPLISVRGGRVDQNATYIDGVPVQNGIHTNTGTSGGGNQVTGAPVLTVATNGFEEASVTTGASSASFGNAQGGIINISTRSGGSKFSGNLGYETGLLGGSYYGQGLNTFKGSFGGPIGKHLTFFISANIEGNNSVNGQNGNIGTSVANHGWLYPEQYSRVSVDTTFTIPNGGKGGTANVVDSTSVTVYNYALTEGGCNLPASQGGFIGANNTAMANNYGVDCHANQKYTAPSTNYFTTDKLVYSFGQGSRLSFTYLYNGNQNRTTLSDGFTGGTTSGANVATLNWNQTIIKQANHQLTLDAYLSRQWSNSISGNLTAASESSTRSSPGGFILSKFQYQFTQKDYPVDSTLIYQILTANATHRIGITDAKNTGQYGGVSQFANSSSAGQAPDGVGYSAGGGGGDPNNAAGSLAYNYENRTVGIANIDFQADRYNRLKIGGQYTSYSILDYSSGATGSGVFPITYDCANMTTLSGCHLSGGGHPVAYNGYAEDRLDLGDVVLVAGIRYDYYSTKAWQWNEFPEISSRPGFLNSAGVPDSLFCPVGTTPSATAKCALVQDPSHSYVSPHIQVSFPVNEKTNFRLSYAQNVQAPDFGLVYKAALFDLNYSGQNQRGTWGGDLDFGKTITFEFGARHAFSDDMVLDVAVYNNDIVADPSFGFEHPIDPVTGSSQILYLVTNKDFGNTRGVDVRLDRRIGNYFNGSLTYSYQDSKNTGADPSAYLGFFEPISGFVGDPPTAALASALSIPQSLTALFNVSLPADWEKGTILGAILNKTGFFVTARVRSGAPYTRCDPNDPGSVGVRSGNACSTLGAVSNFNADRLPMQKQFDLRFAKEFRIGKYAMTASIDARNILNLENVVSVFAQTGTTSSGLNTAKLWSNDSSTFVAYGVATNELNTTTGAITLPGTIAGCAKVLSGTNSYAASCYYMIRSEQRFGNGDGVYTAAEQRVASDAHNAIQNSYWTSVSGARTIRFALEVNF